MMYRAPSDKPKGVHVLNSTADTVDGMFLHLRENPFLCEVKENASR
jgi:hypothetical protein